MNSFRPTGSKSHDVAQSAEHLIADHDGFENFSQRAAGHFSGRKSNRYVVAGMPAHAELAVLLDKDDIVEIKAPHIDTVDQNRIRQGCL